MSRKSYDQRLKERWQKQQEEGKLQRKADLDRFNRSFKVMQTIAQSFSRHR